jgi:hypothetical protein
MRAGAKTPRIRQRMKLFLLQLGLLQPLGVPVPGYLIQTDDGTNVLVDTNIFVTR